MDLRSFARSSSRSRPRACVRVGRRSMLEVPARGGLIEAVTCVLVEDQATRGSEHTRDRCRVRPRDHDLVDWLERARIDSRSGSRPRDPGADLSSLCGGAAHLLRLVFGA